MPDPGAHSGSPVTLDGLLTDEKLGTLLGLGTEYAELDFKRKIDLSSNGDAIKLAKHVGAMQVTGGYIVIGVDDTGAATGDMDDVDLRPFDQANLKPKMLRFLEPPLEISCRDLQVEVDGDAHRVVLIYVGANPDGCAFFRADGNIEGRNEPLFKKGDVFWRDGTSSVRLDSAGLKRVIERRVEMEKRTWIDEQAEIRRGEIAEFEAAARGQAASQGPLGAVNLDLSSDELSLAALELVRRGDEIALTHLFRDSVARARAAIDAGDLDGSLALVLDQLTCLASTFMTYSQGIWFERTIEVFVEIYGYPITSENIRSFGYSNSIDSSEPGPQVWLKIIERIEALGGLAVRTGNWKCVRALTLQLPSQLAENGYYHNWLRHGLTMASRAAHLHDGNRQINLVFSTLELAKENEYLRADGVSPESEELLTSIASFDFLYNVVAVSNAKDEYSSGATFYPSFSQLYQSRIQPVANQLVQSEEMRSELLEEDSECLGDALRVIEEYAHNQGWSFDGFYRWEETPVGKFLEAQNQSS